MRRRVGTKYAHHNGKYLVRGVVRNVTRSGFSLVSKIMINGECKGETTRAVRWEQMPASEQEGLLKDWVPADPGSHAMAAALVVSLGEDAAALDAIVADHPDHPFAPYVRRRALIIREGEAELAARETWTALRGRVTPALTLDQADRLLPAFEDYRKQHGGTKFFASNRKEIEETGARIRRSSSVNLAINGDFETGDLTGWTCRGTSTVEQGVGLNGRFALRVVAGKFGGSILNTAPIETEPGVQYECTARVKFLKGPIGVRFGKPKSGKILSATEPGDTWGKILSATEPGDTWVKLDLSFVATDPTTVIAIQVFRWQGELLIDDIVVKRANTPDPGPE